MMKQIHYESIGKRTEKIHAGWNNETMEKIVSIIMGYVR